MLVAVLPLEEAQRASKAKSGPWQSAAPSAAQQAAAAAAARASGSGTSLSKEMLRLGEALVSLCTQENFLAQDSLQTVLVSAAQLPGLMFARSERRFASGKVS